MFSTATLCLLCIGIFLPCVMSLEIEVHSSNSCTQQMDNCTVIDSAIKNLTSNTTLILASGNHSIQEKHFVSNLTNIAIIGQISEQMPIINCGKFYSLSFTNIQNLQLINLCLHGCSFERTRDMDLMPAFLTIRRTVKFALFLASVENLQMTDVIIEHTGGLGMFGVNIGGNSSIVRTTFLHNKSPFCLTNHSLSPNASKETIGGGAYLSYFDFNSNTSVNLHIEDGSFQFNSDSGYSSFAQTSSQLNEDSLFNGYSIGVGGGLSILTAQYNYAINIKVENTSFYGNNARYGGGAYIGTFTDTGAKIAFIDCVFENNGQDPSYRSAPIAGGGLAILNDLINPLDIREFKELQLVPQNSHIVLDNCTFNDNSAQMQGGGVIAYSFHNSIRTRYLSVYSKDQSNASVFWEFQDCKFTRNRATYGSAALIQQQALHGLHGRAAAHIVNTLFNENGEQQRTENSIVRMEMAALIVRGIQILTRNVAFVSNKISAMLVDSTYVRVHSKLEFTQNRGYVGGGLCLLGNAPIIKMYSNSTLSFRNNTATHAGGAIYYKQSAFNTHILQKINTSDCFLFFQCGVAKNCSLENLNVYIEFVGNQAPSGGMLFGTTLENCLWELFDLDLNSRESNITFIQFLYHEYSNVFSFDVEPFGIQHVSTEPVSLVLNKSAIINTVFPGNVVEVDIDPIDGFGQIVPGIVTSDNSIYNESIEFEARVGRSGFWYLSEAAPKVPLSIRGEELNETLNVSLHISGTDVFAATMIPLTVTQCPIGFTYNMNKSVCQCPTNLPESEIECDSEHFNYTVYDDFWIGIESNTNELITGSCVFANCKPGERSFFPPNFDKQCTANLNKGGVLCGECKENYSHVFGSLKCEKCDSSNLALIAVFACAGILLFLVIGFVGITIDKGWINPVFFFSNMVAFFVTICNPSLVTRLSFLPASLLSLQLGVPLCFHENMSMVQAIGYQIIFLVYLHVLMGIYTIICKKRLVSWLSPVHTFVTLFLMAYFSMLTTCISALAPASLNSLDEKFTLRWVLSPGQLYFQGGHAILGTASLLVLVIYILPFSLLFLFPRFAYKYFGKMKPFFDAFWGPYEDKYRFWLGVQVWIRGLIPIFIYTVSVRILLILIALIFLTFSHIQLIISPYKNKWITRIDSILSAIVVALAVGLLYHNLFLTQTGDQSGVNFERALTGICLCIAYIIFVVVFTVYLVIKYPNLKKLNKWLKRAPKDLTSPTENIDINADSINIMPSNTVIELGDQTPSSEILSPLLTTVNTLPRNRSTPHENSFSYHLWKEETTKFEVNNTHSRPSHIGVALVSSNIEARPSNTGTSPNTDVDISDTKQTESTRSEAKSAKNDIVLSTNIDTQESASLYQEKDYYGDSRLRETLLGKNI